jgi:hypothetical protein
MRLSFRPLGEWPRPKTTNPDRSPFTAKWSDTVVLLEREIGYVILKSKPEVLIQVDAPEGAMTLAGGIRSDARAKFQGVMISFESKYGPQTFMCDKYSAPHWANRGEQAWKDNARAIALGLEALRKIDRYGISNNGQQYTGWKALGSGIPMPAAAKMTVDEAAAILHAAAVPESYEIPVEHLIGNPDAINLAYRTAAKKLHPDKGGDQAKFARISEARDVLLNPAFA